MARILIVFSIVIAMLFTFNQNVYANEQNTTPVAIEVIDNTDYPVLAMGKSIVQGEAVWILQARLNELGYNIEPTGVFDKNTMKLVKLFQVANNIQEDGVVSKEVWENLMTEIDVESCVADPEANAKEEPPAKMMIEIDTVKHTLTVYKNGEIVKTYPCAVGKSKTPSPLGEWKIVHKGLQWGGGFGTRWMGLNVPWGIYGIHGTNKPGSIGTSASHGCIRMFNRDVEELYPTIPKGTKVRIVENGKLFPGDFKPRKLAKKYSGQDVVYVQSQLKELGYVFDNADGRFGNATELAVKYYQVWNGLEVTGEVTEEMYSSMGMIK